MIHDIINNVYKDYKAETSKINPYLEAQLQSSFQAPQNESQRSELREERPQQPLPFNSPDENRSDLRRSSQTRKPTCRFWSCLRNYCCALCCCCCVLRM